MPRRRKYDFESTKPSRTPYCVATSDIVGTDEIEANTVDVLASDLKEEADFVGEFATKSCASNLKEESFKAVSSAKNGMIGAVSTASNGKIKALSSANDEKRNSKNEESHNTSQVYATTNAVSLQEEPASRDYRAYQ